jgi:hypothetical protein
MVAFSGPSRSNRIIRTVPIAMGIFVMCFSVAFGVPPQSVDYMQLSQRQMALASAYFSEHAGNWDGLDSSEQLEFSGATQALETWPQFTPGVPTGQPGLTELVAINAIHGAIRNAPSQDQFNLETEWAAQAKKAFATASGWGSHVSLLHPGMHGYQQNRDGDPFLGIVVLFSDANITIGQFHIGFRTGFGHYFPNNGNIATNYGEYCDWFGTIEGYNGNCGGASNYLNVQDPLRATGAGAAGRGPHQ